MNPQVNVFNSYSSLFISFSIIIPSHKARLFTQDLFCQIQRIIKYLLVYFTINVVLMISLESVLIKEFLFMFQYVLIHHNIRSGNS